MLLVNGELKTADELLEIVNRHTNGDLSRKKLIGFFRKSPSFKINPIADALDLGKSRKSGTIVKKTVKGRDTMAKFRFYSTEDGMSYEVRYTDVTPYKDEKSGTMVYKPKYIDLTGPTHTVVNADGRSFEKMLFLFLTPDNSTSPLHEPGRVFRFTHINNDEMFEAKAAVNQNILVAVRHADTLTDVDVVVYAKALGIPVQGLTPKQAKVELQDYILRGGKNADNYRKHMEDESEVFIGRIIDAIDNKHIVSKNMANSTAWSFDLPNNKDSIVNVPLGTEPREGLIRHIKTNIAEYAPIILGISRDILSDMEYKDYFDQMDGSEKKVPVLASDDVDIRVSEIETFTDARDFYHDFFNKETSAPATIKKFLEAVTSGEINDSNVSEKILEFAPKS